MYSDRPSSLRTPPDIHRTPPDTTGHQPDTAGHHRTAGHSPDSRTSDSRTFTGHRPDSRTPPDTAHASNAGHSRTCVPDIPDTSPDTSDICPRTDPGHLPDNHRTCRTHRTDSQPGPRIPERLPSKRVGVPLAVQRRPAKKNLFCINTSLDSLKALLSPLPPLPMQIRLLHAHAINPRRATYAHRLRALRWGIEARTPPPPPPHQHPRLPGALKAAAGLQPSPSMTFSHHRQKRIVNTTFLISETVKC